MIKIIDGSKVEGHLDFKVSEPYLDGNTIKVKVCFELCPDVSQPLRILNLYIRRLKSDFSDFIEAMQQTRVLHN